MEQDFLEMSPENQYRELWAEYMGTRPGNEELLQWMEREGFFEAPASAKHHGNFPGGLCQHSINVAMEALDLCATPAFKGVPPQEAIAAALLHDICKIGKYWPGSDGKYHYTDNRALGHGSESVIMAQRFIQLTDAEQVAILWHMGLYGDPDKASTLSRAYTLYPLSMLLHFADMMATYCDER